MIKTVERAAEAVDQQVNQIAYERGLSYAEALARIRDERPELLAGFFKLYRQNRFQQRTRKPLFDR